MKRIRLLGSRFVFVCGTQIVRLDFPGRCDARIMINISLVMVKESLTDDSDEEPH